MFSIGTQVKVISSNSIPVGTRGTVVAVDNSRRKHTIGFQADMFIGGHSCDGAGIEGYCKWLKPSQLEELVSTQTVEKGGTVSSLKNVVQTVSRYARKHLDKDVAAFVKLGLLNDRLEVTPKGIEFVAGYLFDAHKVDLGKEARAEIEEIEAEEE